MRKYLILPLIALTLLGAGCLSTASVKTSGGMSDTNSSSGNANNTPVTTGGCPTGMKRFTQDSTQFTFCYPSDGGFTVTASGTTDIMILIKDGSGTVVRELHVLPLADNADKKTVALSYAGAPTDATCDVKTESYSHMDAYTVIGKTKTTAVQSEAATASCRNAAAYTNALKQKPLEDIIFDKDDADYYVLMSDDPDNHFGDKVDDFEDSLDLPKAATTSADAQ